ncbi:MULTISPECIES: amidohydrolase [unclassified Saccharicrinis]|uniref:amidohydrolase n=1 Tax=unclassified Saccharicrinis TaxID=2646859 RepID=UPI003D3562A0
MSFKIALIQYNIVWEEANANLNFLSQLLQEIEDDVDLIVLPEMFATGFSMDTKRIAQEMDGKVVDWLKLMAKNTRAACIGTQAIRENGKVFNRALFVTPEQQISCYDKRHLFSPGNEHVNYTQGRQRTVIHYKGLRILPQICYDLRFPVWSRNRNDYDLAIYMANWPAVRQHVWNTLIKARAIENQCYVCAVNRVGEGGGIQYSGESQMIDFKGLGQLNMAQRNNRIAYSNIDIVSLTSFREKFPSHSDADDFELLTD